jgi:thiol-disulfide isomerase/thioredoxin
MRALLALALLLGCTSAPQAPVVRPADSTLGLLEASLDLDGKVVGSSPAKATVVVVFASWCGHCQATFETLATVRATHPDARMLGVNYRGHEEYDGLGNAEAVRRYVATRTPWLRVVPADEALFGALGRPPLIPTIFVFDHLGRLEARFDRRDRSIPEAEELRALLVRMGA